MIELLLNDGAARETAVRSFSLNLLSNGAAKTKTKETFVVNLL